MSCLNSNRLIIMLCGLIALIHLPVTTVFAQAKTATGFYYPTGTSTPPIPGGTWLATGCDTYISGDYHLGYDLIQPHGSPVYAITDGTIVNITNTGDPDVTFIWVQHQAIDPSNGKTVTFWAVYGHTSIKPGLSTIAPKNSVHGGDIIGYTIVYTPGVDHCHFAVNLNGWFTTVSSYSISYLDNAGNNTSTSVQVGWGRGSGLPSSWCAHKSQNINTLQLRGFVDPLNFITTYRILGSVTNNTDIYVNLNNAFSGDGSAGNPFKTVTAAVNAASATQSVTLHITPGWYHENISTSKNIHFVTNGSGTVRIGG